MKQKDDSKWLHLVLLINIGFSLKNLLFCNRSLHFLKSKTNLNDFYFYYNYVLSRPSYSTNSKI
jgi:hypothetical protein